MKLSLPLLISGISASPFFESDKDARAILTRNKRNNNGIFEETFGANLERECVEEICSFDEVMEVFEDVQQAKDWWEGATNQCNQPGACDATGTQTCVNQWQKHTCECKTGWTGEICDQDVDECADSSWCQNGGACSNSPGSFECSCTEGWEGANCENDKDECLLDACKNGAGCENFDGGFTCSCTAQWTGETCEEDVNECAAGNPCLNDGFCVNTQGDYRCLCSMGWGGKNCDGDYDECAAAFCPQGTVCKTTGMNQFTCECPERGCANLNETVYEADLEQSRVDSGEYDLPETNSTDLFDSASGDDSSDVSDDYAASTESTVLSEGADYNDAAEYNDDYGEVDLDETTVDPVMDDSVTDDSYDGNYDYDPATPANY